MVLLKTIIKFNKINTMGFQLKKGEKPSFLVTIFVCLDIATNIINRAMMAKSKTMLNVNVWLVSTLFY